jgi:AcrR family transcriptional regulator
MARLQLVRGGRADAAAIGLDGGAERRESDATPQRTRIIDGALQVIARQGIGKTTIDEVAREARCSRATVYRVFPGGKDQLLNEVASTEVARFFTALALDMGECSNLEDVLVVGISVAAKSIGEHGALCFLRANEPAVVLTHLAFAHMDEVLATAAAFVAPFLGRFVDHDEAMRLAEWATRIVVSYVACPAEDVDLSDVDQARRVVRHFVLPGVRAVPAVAGADEGNAVVRVLERTVSTNKGEAS